MTKLTLILRFKIAFVLWIEFIKLCSYQLNPFTTSVMHLKPTLSVEPKFVCHKRVSCVM